MRKEYTRKLFGPSNTITKVTPTNSLGGYRFESAFISIPRTLENKHVKKGNLPTPESTNPAPNHNIKSLPPIEQKPLKPTPADTTRANQLAPRLPTPIS